MNIAIFGSAFNPPTIGHLDAIEFVLQRDIDEVWLVPSYSHAFGKVMLDYEVRLAMLNRFVTDIAQIPVKIQAIEQTIAKEGRPVYTWDLLSHLQTTHPKHQFSFVIGPDNQANWHKFYKAQDIQNHWQLLLVPERKPMRSTLVREACEQGKSITGMVTSSVEAFIKQKELYRIAN
ncbi:nicotinate-nicotinamide nucleotide adenylyltransferase [Planctobacterium marinum]|uniref:nicotinate-nucleotide adenylyltransferase n=1 Tax=Planctobacterium marinum TaxID=1631968 RepID=A0AA48KPX0_9ALTE|nr:nicotinate-nicotinamide nucleotide adenylyltransferase [Planctobacterium marinum]